MRFRRLSRLETISIIALFIFVASSIMATYSLRSNNLTMIQLRERVYEADKQDGNTEFALRELRSYVHAHMNTNLSSGSNSIKPPIQLKHTYERLVTAEKQRVATVNAKVYTDGQNYCEQQNPGSLSGRPRVPCVEQYVSTNGVKENPIPDSLYKFDFVSPRWSADIAGLSLVVSAISLIITISSWLIYKLSRIEI